jgi:UDP:flavonoid glycosyltransferase YjiC (YdhE family)
MKTAVVAAGGTGGHLFPAQALSEALIARGWTIVLASDERVAGLAQDFPPPIVSACRRRPSAVEIRWAWSAPAPRC